MKGLHVREPNLELPDLPPGVSEIRITHNGVTYTTHSRKPWTELMAVAERRYTDLRWYETLDRGGHFAAWEQPATFVDQVRGFFRLVR